MILRSKFAPRVSTKSMLFIGLVACVLLPTWMRTSSTQAWAGAQESDGAVRVDEPETPATSEFPFVVQFEQGATRFEPGDEITIEEVRGTAETFVPGNIYWIKGTYKLASHDRAGLSAYTTAMEAKDAISTPFKVQSVRVDRGSGTFTLFLPMTCRGWPHISFYPIERGESFGGNYFGTGEYVLKKWWGDNGKKPRTIEQAITLDKLMWSDSLEFRHRMGNNTVESLQGQLYVVARVEGYEGDWEALKQHQAASSSIFQLEAEESPTLRTRMGSGGITFGRSEAWVMLTVQGRPREACLTPSAPRTRIGLSKVPCGPVSTRLAKPSPSAPRMYDCGMPVNRLRLLSGRQKLQREMPRWIRPTALRGVTLGERSDKLLQQVRTSKSRRCSHRCRQRHVHALLANDVPGLAAHQLLPDRTRRELWRQLLRHGRRGAKALVGRESGRLTRETPRGATSPGLLDLSVNHVDTWCWLRVNAP